MNKGTERQQRVCFEAKKLTVEELAASGDEYYVIPPFQRPYRWSNGQVERLVQDLLDFFEIQRSGDPDCAGEYSLGTVVCDRKDSRFAILDGQQRLTTLDLLLESIAEKSKKPKEEGRLRLIASYQYLSGYENEEESVLPPHKSQKEKIEDVLDAHFKEIADTAIPWTDFENFVRQKVYVTRVTLPLAGGRITGEAAKMFEIINVSGQKLSLLDQIKARLLSVFSEKQKTERAIVSRFWDALPAMLCHPERAAEGFDFVRLTALSDDDLLVEENFSEILGKTSYKDFLRAEDASLGKSQTGEQEAEKTREETDAPEPPIDVGNLLIVANELLRYSLRTEREEKDEKPENTPALKLSYNHFDWLMREKTERSVSMKPSEKVLRLIGTTNLLLQMVGTWGVYRRRGKNPVDVSTVGKLTPMRALELSFMAENRFQGDAQYWFLMLAANALGRLIREEQKGSFLRKRSVSPEAFQKNWSLSAAKLESVREPVFERLVGWAIHRACRPVASVAAATSWGLMSEVSSLRETETDVQSLPEAVRGWKYGVGLRHWQLYLLDWLLWVDGENQWTHLKEALASIETSNDRIDRALRKFRPDDLESIRKNFRIVRHGAIEHWFPREMANEEWDRLEKLDGFGNLALIDTGLNSRLRDLPVDQKRERVKNSNANHSLKLGWLAVFTAACPDYDWDDVEALTAFWGAYLSGYPLDSLTDEWGTR